MLKRNLTKIGTVSIIWSLSWVVCLFIEKGALGDLDYYPSTGNPFNFQRGIIVVPIFTFIVGAIFGSVEVFWLNDRFKSSSLGKKILIKTVFYVSAILLVILLGSAVFMSVNIEQPVWSQKVAESILAFFSGFAFISIMVYLGFLLIGTLFFLEISDNLGQGVPGR